MKIAELMMSTHRKDFNMEKEIKVKKYLPIKTKQAIAMKILEECATEELGILKIDSVQRYMSYVKYMITAHTNLQYSDTDYDTLCSTVYQDSTLLNAIMKCFESDATECSRILNLMTDDFIKEHSIENSVAHFLYNLNQLADKINNFDVSTLLPHGIDADQAQKIIDQYVK